MSILKKYIESNFELISLEQQLKLLSLFNIYKKWNSQINLISRKDIENLDLHHVIHSLLLTKSVANEKITKIMDVGTGGGFPGIPLAILFPQIQFYLLDSIRKKIDAVQMIAQELNLKNVVSICDRVENIKLYVDCVVGRGVTFPLNFFKITHHLIDSHDLSLGRGLILYLSGPSDIASVGTKFSVENILCKTLYDNEFFESKRIYKFFIKNW